MKFLFDLLPVALFFVVFRFAGIYAATAVAIATSVLQVGWLKLRRRRVHAMLWVSLAVIVVFGGATLLFQDEIFIKWKPTVLYWVFGLVLAGSAMFLRKNLIRAMHRADRRIILLYQSTRRVVSNRQRSNPALPGR